MTLRPPSMVRVATSSLGAGDAQDECISGDSAGAGNFGLRIAGLRVDRVQDVGVLGKIGDQHLVEQPRRAVLHDGRRLRQERHIERRRMRIAGEGRR